MKINVFNVIVSILLLIVSLAALAAAGWGGLECYLIIKLKGELPDTEPVEKLEEAIGLLRDNEKVYLEGVDLCYEGDYKLLQGHQVIYDGKNQLAQGEEALAEAQKQYDDAEAQLKDGKAKFAEAKAQMEDTRPQYEEGKEQLRRLELLQPLLHTYCDFKNGVLVEIPGFNSLNAWYKAVVIPYIASIGLELPSDMDAFAEYMDEQIAAGNAMLAEYEAAEAQLDDAQKQIDEADAQLAEANKVLEGKYQDLDKGYEEIRKAENSLYYATSKLSEGKATLGEFEEAVTRVETTLAELMKTKSVCGRMGNVGVEGLAARLGEGFDIYKYNEDGEILSLTNGNPRLDYDKCLNVCGAYRDYIKDYGKDLSRETTLRIILNSALFVCAIFAFIAAIKALRDKAAAAKLGVILFVLLVLSNAYGVYIGYTSFAHPDGQDNYTGLLPFLGMAALTAMSLLFMVTSLLGRRKFLKLAAASEKREAEKT